MLKRNWHYLLLIVLLADLGYSFWQYLQFPLDGDVAAIGWPSEVYTPVLHDPFGLRVLLHNEVYAAPNRFFAHFFLYQYMRGMPLLLQPLLSPLNSVYAACALLKLAVHALLVYVLAVAISNTTKVLSKRFLLAAVLITPLFQASGFSGQMGVVDWSITYAIFYALPMSLLLLFLLPFLRAALHGTPVRLSVLSGLCLGALAVVLALSGPVVPATVLVVCPAVVLISWLRGISAQPATVPWWQQATRAVAQLSVPTVLLFGFISLLSLYSMYIGRNNLENNWTNMPLLQRYSTLPAGAFAQFTGKLGLPLLLIMLLINVVLLRRAELTPLSATARTALKWLGLFALVYILLLPLGGYRTYREDIIRRDAILPIIIGMIGSFAFSAYALLSQLPAASRRRYAAGVFVFLAIFTIADKPRPRDFNTCERQLFELLAQSPAPIVRLPATCTMMDWQPLTDYHKSELDGWMLHYWGITKTRKLYYQQ